MLPPVVPAQFPGWLPGNGPPINVGVIGLATWSRVRLPTIVGPHVTPRPRPGRPRNKNMHINFSCSIYTLFIHVVDDNVNDNEINMCNTCMSECNDACFVLH